MLLNVNRVSLSLNVIVINISKSFYYTNKVGIGMIWIVFVCCVFLSSHITSRTQIAKYFNKT